MSTEPVFKPGTLVIVDYTDDVSYIGAVVSVADLGEDAYVYSIQTRARIEGGLAEKWENGIKIGTDELFRLPEGCAELLDALDYCEATREHIEKGLSEAVAAHLECGRHIKEANDKCGESWDKPPKENS